MLDGFFVFQGTDAMKLSNGGLRAVATVDASMGLGVSVTMTEPCPSR